MSIIKSPLKVFFKNSFAYKNLEEANHPPKLKKENLQNIIY